MKKKMLVVGFILSLLLTFFSVQTYSHEEGKIVIESTGRAWATSKGDLIKYGCDNSDNTKCTITIFPSEK